MKNATPVDFCCEAINEFNYYKRRVLGVCDEERWCPFYKCNIRLQTRESTNSLVICTWLAHGQFMVLLIVNKEQKCAVMECLFKPMSVKYWRSKNCWPQGQLCWPNSCSRFPWGRQIVLRFFEIPTMSYAPYTIQACRPCRVHWSKSKSSKSHYSMLFQLGFALLDQ